MSRGLKKFFAICAIAVGVGLIMSIIGFAAGGAGMEAIDKMANKYDWIVGSPGNVQYINLEEGSAFDSVDIKGEIDVVFYEGEGTTGIQYRENETVPQIHVESGVLKVEAGNRHNGGVVDFNYEDTTPVLSVYCGTDNALTDINIDLNYGDTEINGISVSNIKINTDMGDTNLYKTHFNTASISTNAGDVEATGIVSRGLNIENDMGSCELSGEFTGNTQIIADSGDVDVYTSLPEEQYTVTADISSGDLTINGREFDAYEHSYRNGAGVNSININMDMGDVEIYFGRHYDQHYDD